MNNKQRRAIARAFELRKQATHAGISRREFMKLGGAAASAAFLGLGGSRWLGADGGSVPLSPPTTPFAAPLPIPPVMTPVANASLLNGGMPNPAVHQFYNMFPPAKFYEYAVREGYNNFHPELGPSRVWSYEGVYPGPTLVARYGEPVLLRIHNALPTNEQLLQNPTFGTNQVLNHLHNFHSCPFSDGGPWDWYNPGEFQDHHYTMARAGFTSPTTLGVGDVRETLGTLFFHAHRPDFTTQNVYKGQVAFFLCFDDLDSGSEESGLRLPSGPYDVPLLFADKVFEPSGELFFDAFDLDGILGDKFTVNGVVQPYLRVKRRKYRFRFLNSGPSRFYQFYLTKNGSYITNPFIQIANDGNLLRAPVRRSSVDMAVAERVDVVIDFSAIAQPGDEIILVNRLEQTNGRGPTGSLLNPGHQIMKFIVEESVADGSQVPMVLREQPTIDLTSVAQTRTWRFERGNGAWQINGRFFDPQRSEAQVRRNSAEIWVLQNNSGGWSHPIHIHHEEFRILSRNGKTPPSWEQGRKDVVRLGPNEEIRVYIRFRDFPDPNFTHPIASQQANVGRYPMHCHNTTHEDHAMMLRWDIVP